MTRPKKTTQDPFLMSLQPKADMHNFELEYAITHHAHKPEGKIYPLLRRIASKTKGMLAAICL